MSSSTTSGTHSSSINAQLPPTYPTQPIHTSTSSAPVVVVGAIHPEPQREDEDDDDAFASYNNVFNALSGGQHHYSRCSHPLSVSSACHSHLSGHSGTSATLSGTFLTAGSTGGVGITHNSLNGLRESDPERWRELHSVDQKMSSIGEVASCTGLSDDLDGDSIADSTISGSASALSCMHVPEHEHNRMSNIHLERTIDTAELREQEENLRAVYENTRFEDLCVATYDLSESISDQQTTTSRGGIDAPPPALPPYPATSQSQPNAPPIDILQRFLRNLRVHCPEPPSEDGRSMRSLCLDENCNCRLNSTDFDALSISNFSRGHRHNRSVGELESIGCASESHFSSTSLVSDAEYQRALKSGGSDRVD